MSLNLKTSLKILQVVNESFNSSNIFVVTLQTILNKESLLLKE